MPTYEYRCTDDSCGKEFECVLPVAQYADPQSCPRCASPANKLVSRTAGFILVGDDWAGKNIKIAGQMAKKNARLDAKRADTSREHGMNLLPNVGGERVDSWNDAAKLARSQGKDSTGYEKKAQETKK